MITSGEGGLIKSLSLAILPIVFVPIASIVASITLPAPGTSLSKLIIPFEPNLVNNLKPTFWFVFLFYL